MLLMILSGLSFYLYIIYRRSEKDYLNQKNINDNYISEIRKELEDFTQLRTGFINTSITYTRDDGEESYNMLLEIKELRRTPTKSYVNLIDYKSIDRGDINRHRNDHQSEFFIGISNLYNGWMESSNAEWVQEIDNREEVIDKLLIEIEKEQNK